MKDIFSYSEIEKQDPNQIKCLVKKSPHTCPQPHILLVEDDEGMLDYISALLIASYRVSLARNGHDALHELNAESIDLIVSDIAMPIMDGLDLLKTIRNSNRPIIPFLILTGHTGKHNLLNALHLGVDSYLTKPFDGEELLAHIENLLTNSRRRNNFFISSDRENAVQSAANTAAGLPHSFCENWLNELATVVRAEIANPQVKISDIAFKMAVSERTLRTRIRQYTGLSPSDFLTEARLLKARQLLERQTYLTVAEVAFAVGISSSSYFTKVFRGRFGKAPLEYM